MTYSDTPQASQLQSATQSQIRTNFQLIDSVFGTDHYAVSDQTGDAGHHQVIQSPVQASHATTTTNPAIYGMQDTANIGVLQYSRAPSNAVPTPLTGFFSVSTPISMGATSTINLLNFTGLTVAIVNLYAFGEKVSSGSLVNLNTTIYWNGTDFANLGSSTLTLYATSSGSTLILGNSSSSGLINVYWNLQFIRLQT